MRSYVKFLVVPAMMLGVACGRDAKQAPTDDALKNDLSLASTSQPYQPQQVVSPMEQGYVGSTAQKTPGYAAPAPRYSSPAPRRSASTAVRRTSSASRSSGASSSGGGYSYPQPSERVIREKHTKRDAIVGAAAGGVLGAVTSRDKVKGAVIGAAAGGLLGGIIGNNVDIKKRRVPF